MYRLGGKIIRLEDISQDAPDTKYHQKFRSAKVREKNAKGKQQWTKDSSQKRPQDSRIRQMS